MRAHTLLTDSIAEYDVIHQSLSQAGERRNCTALLLSRLHRAIVLRQRRRELDCAGIAP